MVYDPSSLYPFTPLYNSIIKDFLFLFLPLCQDETSIGDKENLVQLIVLHIHLLPFACVLHKSCTLCFPTPPIKFLFLSLSSPLPQWTVKTESPNRRMKEVPSRVTKKEYLWPSVWRLMVLLRSKNGQTRYVNTCAFLSACRHPWTQSYNWFVERDFPGIHRRFCFLEIKKLGPLLANSEEGYIFWRVLWRSSWYCVYGTQCAQLLFAS
jgi:hypothetical protein